RTVVCKTFRFSGECAPPPFFHLVCLVPRADAEPLLVQPEFLGIAARIGASCATPRALLGAPSGLVLDVLDRRLGNALPFRDHECTPFNRRSASGMPAAKIPLGDRTLAQLRRMKRSPLHEC